MTSTRWIGLAGVVWDWLCILFVLFVFFGIGPMMAWDGIERGRRYGDVDRAAPLTLLVTGKENLGGEWVLKDLRAVGYVEESTHEISVPVFAAQYERIEPGSKLTVYETGDADQPFVFERKLAESDPMFRLLGLTFSWHLPVGIAILMIGAVYVIAGASGRL